MVTHHAVDDFSVSEASECGDDGNSALVQRLQEENARLRAEKTAMQHSHEAQLKQERRKYVELLTCMNELEQQLHDQAAAPPSTLGNDSTPRAGVESSVADTPDRFSAKPSRSIPIDPELAGYSENGKAAGPASQHASRSAIIPADDALQHDRVASGASSSTAGVQPLTDEVNRPRRRLQSGNLETPGALPTRLQPATKPSPGHSTVAGTAKQNLEENRFLMAAVPKTPPSPLGTLASGSNATPRSNSTRLRCGYTDSPRAPTSLRYDYSKVRQHDIYGGGARSSQKAHHARPSAEVMPVTPPECGGFGFEGDMIRRGRPKKEAPSLVSVGVSPCEKESNEDEEMTPVARRLERQASGSKARDTSPSASTPRSRCLSTGSRGSRRSVGHVSLTTASLKFVSQAQPEAPVVLLNLATRRRISDAAANSPRLSSPASRSVNRMVRAAEKKGELRYSEPLTPSNTTPRKRSGMHTAYTRKQSA